ncbi:PQQ-dependent sugar dehydrogenase [Candidatus Desantisbacteria bacterium]|nr:PQQ-dependent sugar dehydrogenase [Candidatus Desantisbacteria bacterium]
MKKKYIKFILLISITYLSLAHGIAGKDIISSLTLPPGFSISLFCFGLGTPCMMTFDAKDNLILTVPMRGAVVALPDLDKDGKADNVVNLLLGIHFPSGIDISNDNIYIAANNGIIKASYDPYSLKVTNINIINSNLQGDRDKPVYRVLKCTQGRNILVSVIAPCDSCLPSNTKLGSILEYNGNGENEKIFASGFLSVFGMAYSPGNLNLWAADSVKENMNEKEISEELNLIIPKKFYGWPYFYGDNVPNPSYKNQNLIKYAIKPQFKLPARSSPYGLKFYSGNLFPEDCKGDLFIALHGKNRNRNGYKIIQVIFSNNNPTKIRDFITGWISPDVEIKGQPLDIAFNSKGEMFITDDYSGNVYKVIYKKP